MAEPKVSIIVPIYNTESYLSQCVDSIRHQTMENIEIILVDDGSSDRCPQMCDQFAAEDLRIQVIHQKNTGVAAARNAGMHIATGEWLMFVDSDDWLEKNALEVLFRHIVGTDCDIVCGSYYKNRSYPSKQVVDSVLTPEKREYSVKCNLDFFFSRIVCAKKEDSGILSSPWGKLYKADIIRGNQLLFLPGVQYGEDTLFNLYAFTLSKKICMLNDPLYHYRIQSTSTAHTLFSNQEVMYNAIWSEMKCFMNQFNINSLFLPYYYFFVVNCNVRYAKLLGATVSSISTFYSSVKMLKSLAQGTDSKQAFCMISASNMPTKKGKLIVWLFKHHLYRTIILISMGARQLKQA